MRPRCVWASILIPIPLPSQREMKGRTKETRGGSGIIAEEIIDVVVFEDYTTKILELYLHIQTTCTLEYR